MQTLRTKKYKKLSILFTVLSWFLCFGITIALIGIGFATKWNTSNGALKETIGTFLYGTIISLLPIIALSFIVRDRIKPTVRMANIILSAYCVGNALMWVVFAVMMAEIYIITPLAISFRAKYTINKEMDKRGTEN